MALNCGILFSTLKKNTILENPTKNLKKDLKNMSNGYMYE